MGKSSSQVVGYRYYAKFAAFIGNRIEKLIAINFDNRKWLTRRPGESEPNLAVYAPNLYGENEGGVDGLIDVFIGTPNQQPSEVYQQYFPLVSGYPYQSYLVFHSGSGDKGFYLGNSGYMKEMLLWVKRIHVRNDSRWQWYDDKSEIGDFSSRAYIEEYFSRISLSYSDLTGPKVAYRADSAFANFEHSAAISNCNFKFEVGSASTIHFRLYIRVRGGVCSLVSQPRDSTYIVKQQDEGLGAIGYIYNFYLAPRARTAVEFGFRCDIRETEPHPSLQSSYLMQIADEPIVTSGYIFTTTGGVDINPIHKIREILTDDTAMGKPESDVNDVNFMKAADRIYDEGLGISWAIDEKSCIEAIEELCYHIEAGIRVNRQTGLYEIVLFRDDWFSEDEIHDITESKIKNLSLEVMNSDDIVNQLNVTYYDRQRIKKSTFSIYENGSILTMGHTNAESIDFPYFMNMRNAEIVANWKLKQFSTPAWSGSFTTGWREARKWNRYDLIRLPWSKKWNGTILVRIMKINLGNGTDNTVTIDFEEVIPYSGEMNTSVVVDESMEEKPLPPQPSINAVFEAPYYLTVLKNGQTSVDAELSSNPDIGYVVAIAAKPQNNSLNALLFTDGGVGEFEQVSRLDYCDILQLDQPIIETASSFTVTGSLTQAANSNNLILLNGELMGFVSFDDETKVLTVKRGVSDTVPKKHNSGSLFVFDLPDIAFDSTQYVQSEIVEAQVLTTTPSGIQELSATGMPVEIQARAIRPYPPANVKINGEYFPDGIETDLILTWANRNRAQQTGGELLSWYDSGVILESGVAYELTLIERDGNNTELTNQTLILGVLNTYTFKLVDMNEATDTIEITLKSIRDGYECFMLFNYIIRLFRPFSEPYNLVLEYMP